jgi:ribosomal protein S18 acetylase RimI-like enzyme
LSAIALSDGQVVGTALASHDGRRGFLQHVVVAARLRKQGIAKDMVERCVSRLRAENLAWVHLDVSVENASALAYWTREGWRPRDELVRLSMAL